MSHLPVRFLTRPGCHLCDQARPLLLRVAARMGVEVVEVSVDNDERLLGEYGARIPVVLAPDHRVIAEGVIDDAAVLRRMMRRALGS